MATSTSSIDITSKNIYGNCDLKCNYSFNYPESNLIAKNNGVFISLKYENNSNPAVLYNGSKYNINSINIYSPSLHLYNGEKASGELIIEHQPIMGGKNLYVCIPIYQSLDQSDGSILLNKIITDISKKAPVANNITNLNISNFTLQNIIPKKPFYSYIGSEDIDGDFIVFGINSGIPLSETILSSLSKIISPFTITLGGDKLFFNSKGPNADLPEQGIYISCQPTGSSKEKIEVLKEKEKTSYDISFLHGNKTTSTIINFIVLCIIIIVCIIGLGYLFHYLTKSKTTNSSSLMSNLPFFKK